jgi:hypothetical protein
LVGVYLPKGIKTIGTSSFEYLLNAKTVTLSEGLISIGESAFRGPTTGKSSIEITSLPSTLTSIGEEAFYRNDGISITSIPKGIIELPYRCFYNCANIRVDTFGSAEGESLMTIGEDCFKNAGSSAAAINRIYLHKSVKVLGSECFVNYGGSTGPKEIYTTLPADDPDRLAWDIADVCGGNGATVSTWDGN